MTKQKRATVKLVSSVLSLFACVAVFIGMTFAWFTDSVTSGKNKIQAGNLDVKFEYSKTLEAGSWKEITNTTSDIFTDVNGNDILWEPGAATVVYLKIKNAGTLALKYNLGIDVVSEVAGTNVDNGSFKLSNYIQFGQVELQSGDLAFADRDSAIQAVSESKKISEGYTLDGAMKSNSEKIVALVVYMPENVGNVANYKTGTDAPEINMGMTLLATQASQETDGFNKFYDSYAAYSSTSAVVSAGEDTVLKLGSVAEIIVPADAKTGNSALEDGEKLILSVQPETTTPNGYSITSGAGTTTYDITIVNEDGDKVTDENGAIKVRFFVGEGGATEVKHIVNGVEEDVPFTVDGNYIVFSTSSFSPYVIRSKYVAKVGETKYESLQEALNNAKNGEKVVVLSNIHYENCNDAPLKYQTTSEDISAVLDLNGKTVSATLNNGKSIALLKVGNVNADKNAGTATLTIEDSSENMTGTLTVVPTVASDGWTVAVETVVVERLGRLTVNSGNIITHGGIANGGNPYGILVLTNTGAQTAELTINGGYIESKSSSGMAIRVAANSEKAAVKFTMNGGTVVGAADGRGIWLHHMAGSGKHQLIETTINGGIIKADRALEIGDFNKDTDVSENIYVELNGGKFISTNNNGNTSHPNCSDIFTSKSTTYYNMEFSHVKLVDNRK